VKRFFLGVSNLSKKFFEGKAPMVALGMLFFSKKLKRTKSIQKKNFFFLWFGDLFFFFPKEA